MKFEDFNKLDAESANKIMQDCNAAEGWAGRIVAARPFMNLDALKATAAAVWSEMQEPDLLQAFEAHPMIGNVDTLRQKYASTKAMASGEQAGAGSADEVTLQELAELNQKYFERFGFIFIVFATGKSAAEMLALLKARFPNSRDQEIRNAAAEQIKITLLRLEKLFVPKA
jgi:2-oxo-4-hydroxy-4-carboxy-5-ureidoimidazoline decarboxylase